MRTAPLPSALALLLALGLPAGARGSTEGGPEDLRVGVTFGGISLIGFVVEYRWGSRSLDLNVGTWAFRDLSVSLVGKQYFGPGSLRPYSGAGVWGVWAPRHRPGEQMGFALVLQAPVGVDWNSAGEHSLGGVMNLNRALWLRRRDPADDTPPSDRLIPLPGFYYRWAR